MPLREALLYDAAMVTRRVLRRLPAQADSCSQEFPDSGPRRELAGRMQDASEEKIVINT